MSSEVQPSGAPDGVDRQPQGNGRTRSTSAAPSPRPQAARAPAPVGGRARERTGDERPHDLPLVVRPIRAGRRSINLPRRGVAGLPKKLLDSRFVPQQPLGRDSRLGRGRRCRR